MVARTHDALNGHGGTAGLREDQNSHALERRYGTFSGPIRLPFALDSGNVEAKFIEGTAGVLARAPRARQEAEN